VIVQKVLTTLLIVALTLVALLGGGLLELKLSGWQRPSRGQSPLFIRLAGYSVGDVAAYWKDIAARDVGLRAERRFLEIDLIFLFVYGGSLCASLLLLGVLLGRSFPPVLPISLVAITMVADWTENLFQLRELGRFVSEGAAGLEDGWIRWASIGTTVKLVGTGCCLTALFLLALIYVVRG
jgi:hypothetical protein